MPSKKNKSAAQNKPSNKEKAVDIKKKVSPEQDKGNGMFVKLGLAIGIVLVVVIAAALLFSQNNNSSSQYSQLPQFPNTNATVPSEFTKALNGNKSFTNGLANISQKHLAGVKNITVVYNGTLYVNPTGLSGILGSVSSPIYMRENILNGKRKLYVNVTKVPFLGTVQINYLELSNGTFTCINFNSTALQAGNMNKLLLGKRNLNCTRTSILAGVNLTKIAGFNFSQLKQNGIVIRYAKPYQSIYKNTTQCTYVGGTLTQVVGNNSIIGEGAFNMCISDAYGIPLSAYAYLNTTRGQGSVQLTEIGLYNNSFPATSQ